MAYDERIRIMPCGCRYDVKTGVVTDFCAHHGADDYEHDYDDQNDGWDDEWDHEWDDEPGFR